MVDEAVRLRIEEARGEAERAAREIAQLFAGLDSEGFDESRHEAAKAHLRAALAALDSLRPAHLAPPPGSV